MNTPALPSGFGWAVNRICWIVCICSPYCVRTVRNKFFCLLWCLLSGSVSMIKSGVPSQLGSVHGVGGILLSGIRAKIPYYTREQMITNSTFCLSGRARSASHRRGRDMERICCSRSCQRSSSATSVIERV